MFYIVRGKFWTIHLKSFFRENVCRKSCFNQLGSFREARTLRTFVFQPTGSNGVRRELLTPVYSPEVPCTKISRKAFLSSYTGQKTLKTKIWRIIRVLFMITGGLVWAAPVVMYASIFTGIVQVDVEEKELQGAGDDLSSRLLSFYNVEKDSHSSSKEINSKEFALHNIWEKLRLEEGVTRKFGSPVHISGFRISHEQDELAIDVSDSNNVDLEKGGTEVVHEPKENTTWNASCYVEGPKHNGILDVRFKKVDDEWIPVSLNLETLQKSGEVICHVSAPPPNGLTRFTRLSDI